MKIFIADSQSRVRYGLHKLLEQQPGWHVTGEAASAIELIEQVCWHPPDVVLLDCDLPGMSLEMLLKSLREACPKLFVISLSGRDELRQSAFDAGADAFASKAESPEKLIRLIWQLMNTESKVGIEKKNNPSLNP